MQKVINTCALYVYDKTMITIVQKKQKKQRSNRSNLKTQYFSLRVHDCTSCLNYRQATTSGRDVFERKHRRGNKNFETESTRSSQRWEGY